MPMDSKQYIRRFDVYWVDLDPTHGSEIQKTRPCIVVSPNEMNQALRTIVVVPLTSIIVTWPFRCIVTVGDKESSAACDQIRTISITRLRGSKIYTLSAKEQDQVVDILLAMFAV